MLCALVAEIAYDETPPHAALGRSIHAFWLDRFADFSPDLAAALHDGDGPRPFSGSELRSPKGCRGWIRLSTLAGPLSQALCGPLAEQLVQMAFDRTTFALKPLRRCRITRVTVEPRLHPWAGETSYQALMRRYLSSGRTPDPVVGLDFAAPTTFHQGTRHMPLPLPELVFGSLIERWNAYAPRPAPAELADYAAALAISRHTLRSRYRKYKGEATAFLGDCQYRALAPEPTLQAWLHLLGAYAFFAGVGAWTSYGLGMARRLR